MKRSTARAVSLSAAMTGVWLAGLLGLAIASPSHSHGGEGPVCFSHTSTTSVYQDARGAHTVLLRTVRPVAACR